MCWCWWLVSNFLLIILRIHRRGGGYPPTHPHSAVKYKIFNNKIKIKLTAEGVCRTSYKIFLVQGGPPCTPDLKFCRMFCIPLLRSLYFISAIKYNKVDRRIKGGGYPFSNPQKKTKQVAYYGPLYAFPFFPRATSEGFSLCTFSAGAWTFAPEKSDSQSMRIRPMILWIR